MNAIPQNALELQVTKAQLAKLEIALSEAQAKLSGRDDLPKVIKRGHLNGIAFLIGDLQEQIADCENLLEHPTYNGGVTPEPLC